MLAIGVSTGVYVAILEGKKPIQKSGQKYAQYSSTKCFLETKPQTTWSEVVDWHLVVILIFRNMLSITLMYDLGGDTFD